MFFETHVLLYSLTREYWSVIYYYYHTLLSLLLTLSLLYYVVISYKLLIFIALQLQKDNYAVPNPSDRQSKWVRDSHDKIFRVTLSSTKTTENAMQNQEKQRANTLFRLFCCLAHSQMPNVKLADRSLAPTED